MDFFYKNKKKLDSRVFLTKFQLKNGNIETLPLGSFPFEFLLPLENLPTNVFSSTCSTPNTFFNEIDQKHLFKISQASKTAKTGFSAGFFFYEQTCWNEKKTQKNETPFFYSLNTVNVFNNVRWVLFFKSENNSILSISKNQPAATWSEREIRDMFNINIKNLKDTRRLLLDYKTSRGVLSPQTKIKGLPQYNSFYDIYYI